jgi:hypothetical protein
MIYVVVMKRFIGLPLLIHIELLRRSRSRSFKNRGVGVGVGAFVYRLHSPADRLFPDLANYQPTQHNIPEDRRSFIIQYDPKLWDPHIFLLSTTERSIYGLGLSYREFDKWIGRSYKTWNCTSIGWRYCVQIVRWGVMTPRVQTYLQGY